ncbi:hypothetical protein OIO90_003388 [Microbotryomycetes sp. JL221]|nr:hypothetical protein OIO90_003388 [Microbotryomycetes sp. JL221]
MATSDAVAGSSNGDGEAESGAQVQITVRGPILSGPASEDLIKQFLDSCKPSSNSAEQGSWYWVRIHGSKHSVSSRQEQRDENLVAEDDKSDDDFMTKGAELVEAMTTECARIKAEAPVRANKAKGTKSQKEREQTKLLVVMDPGLNADDGSLSVVREAEHAKFNEAIKALAQKHDKLTGKWLLYPTVDSVDGTWAKVVRAIAGQDGVLAQTEACHVAKVSTVVQGEGPFVICIYCDDSWDKEAVGKVMRVLVQELGLLPSAYKHDVNTILGIDSKHPSQIKSSLYGKNDFMTKEEIDAVMSARSKAREVKPSIKTAEEEEQDDGGASFAPLSESDDDDKPSKKKAKTL